MINLFKRKKVIPELTGRAKLEDSVGTIGMALNSFQRTLSTLEGEKESLKALQDKTAMEIAEKMELSSDIDKHIAYPDKVAGNIRKILEG